MPVKVVNPEGQVVRDLTALDFEVLINGRQQEVVGARFVSTAASPRKKRPEVPGWPPADVASNKTPAERAFVFVIDPEPQLLPLFERVLSRLFNSLASTDLAAVVFPGRSDLSEDFTSDPARIFGTLGRMRPAADRKDLRWTRRALENALVSLKAVPQPQRVVVWVSTGFNVPLLPAVRNDAGPIDGLTLSRSRNMADEIYQLVKAGARSGIPIHTLDPSGLQDGMSVSTDLLRVVSLGTGGVSLVGRSDIVESASTIVEESDDYYVIGFHPTQDLPAGDLSPVSIRVREQPAFEVRAQTGYVPVTDKPTAGRSQLVRDLASGRGRTGIALQVAAAPLEPTVRNRSLVAVTVSVDLPGLGSSGVPDDRGFGAHTTLEFVAMALTKDAKLVDSIQRSIDIPAGARRALKGPVIFTDLLEIPPGTSVIRVGVADGTNGTSGTVSLGLDVPKFSDNTRILAPLVIGVDAAAAAPGVQTQRRAGFLPFEPTASRKFSSDQTLNVYSRAFGLGSAASGSKASLMVVSGAVTVRRTPGVITSAAAGPQRGSGVSASMPLTALTPGTYLLVLELLAPDGSRTTRSVQFDIGL